MRRSPRRSAPSTRPAIATIISIGALAGLTTVMMILMIGQSRVFFAMSRDRLLPPAFAGVHTAPARPSASRSPPASSSPLMAALLPLRSWRSW